MIRPFAIGRRRLGFATLILPAILAAPAHANNYGEKLWLAVQDRPAIDYA